MDTELIRTFANEITTIWILVLWVYWERQAHRDDVAYYRARVDVDYRGQWEKITELIERKVDMELGSIKKDLGVISDKVGNASKQ